VLENAVKAQKLRSTLGVFEKSKFLFNLPGQLMDSINVVSVSILIFTAELNHQGKYDQAMRDYKKGSFLNSSKSSQLIPGLPANTPAQKAQHKRVFDKVWSSVERIMSDMKTKLDRTLKDHNRSTEEQEKTIE
jgi:exocyst complex component 2